MEGYAKLAALMGAYPEAAILRRFGALGMQNLLYLQAELVQLESEFRHCSNENDNSENIYRAVFSKDWVTLAGYNDGEEEQWALALRIREKLKEYGQALLLQTQLSDMKQPRPQDLAFLQKWMKRPSMGCVYLLGQDSDIWEKPERTDLVALNRCKSEGVFSLWVTETVIHQYHQLVGKYFRKPESAVYSANTVHYSQEGLSRIVSLVAMSFSSLLPIAAVTALYCVNSMSARLGMMAGFTVLFTLCFGILTNARSTDVFTATTAFAAVQVVFIGTSGVTT
ncbi:hypothetical protein MMC11_001239 [Xylographa trunciseda]|nr:hypothetical protein [Xylographa trunciseda]